MSAKISNSTVIEMFNDILSASNPYNKSILLHISPANQTKSRTQDLLYGLFVI